MADAERTQDIPAPVGRLEFLDLVRFSAALMVVACHWLFNGINNGKVEGVEYTPLASVARYGFLGVYLFFIVSGYVISQSAIGKTPHSFITGRAVRLFPAYWFAMTLTTAVLAFWGTNELQVSPAQFIANLTMMPGLFGQAPIDGVYWTLTVELTFYFGILVLLMARLGPRLPSLFPAWGLTIGAVALSGQLAPSTPWIGAGYSFFAAGAIMSSLRSENWTLSSFAIHSSGHRRRFLSDSRSHVDTPDRNITDPRVTVDQ